MVGRPRSYAHIISDMVWSYSRITAYEDCPYKWFLSYIKRLDKKKLFFASYGSFMHRIIQKYLTGELRCRELTDYYLQNFRRDVGGSAPKGKVFDNYLKQGAEYLRHISFPYHEIIAIERKVEFEISGIPFVGFIDIVAGENGIILVDNKSRNLKKRTGRQNPTQADNLLDKYLRQLYLYSIPIGNQFQGFPVRLDFNCFRSNMFIMEPFIAETFHSTQKWALERIDTITNTTVWKPKLDYFKCGYLCDVCHHCDYYTLFRGGGT